MANAFVYYVVVVVVAVIVKSGIAGRDVKLSLSLVYHVFRYASLFYALLYNRLMRPHLGKGRFGVARSG